MYQSIWIIVINWFDFVNWFIMSTICWGLYHQVIVTVFSCGLEAESQNNARLPSRGTVVSCWTDWEILSAPALVQQPPPSPNTHTHWVSCQCPLKLWPSHWPNQSLPEWPVSNPSTESHRTFPEDYWLWNTIESTHQALVSSQVGGLYQATWYAAFDGGGAELTEWIWFLWQLTICHQHCACSGCKMTQRSQKLVLWKPWMCSYGKELSVVPGSSTGIGPSTSVTRDLVADSQLVTTSVKVNACGFALLNIWYMFDSFVMILFFF